MEIAGTSSSTAAIAVQKQSGLDRDAFLKILVAQLKNQDPLSPLQDKDFIAQVAQFSMLEEIKRLGENYDQMKAMGYLGKNVAAIMGEAMIHGKVDSVSISGKDMLLYVGEHAFRPEDITGVFNEDQ